MFRYFKPKPSNPCSHFSYGFIVNMSLQLHCNDHQKTLDANSYCSVCLYSGITDRDITQQSHDTEWNDKHEADIAEQ